MNVVVRRKLLEAAQALVKTNAPSIEHYENVLHAVAQVYSADTGRVCDCVIRVKKTGAEPQKAQSGLDSSNEVQAK